tara:strand:+ start:3243 stop:3452 length:210 start_codon:yes stop_codon:yes gene_type:complete
MMITTTVMFIVQVIIVSWVIATNPEPCPRKYMKLIEDGGEIEHYGQIHKYCKTTSMPSGIGYTWSLKED